MCKEHHHCSHHQAQECGHCHHEHGNARLPLRIGAAVLLFAAAVSGLLPPALLSLLPPGSLPARISFMRRAETFSAENGWTKTP